MAPAAKAAIRTAVSKSLQVYEAVPPGNSKDSVYFLIFLEQVFRFFPVSLHLHYARRHSIAVLSGHRSYTKTETLIIFDVLFSPFEFLGEF